MNLIFEQEQQQKQLTQIKQINKEVQNQKQLLNKQNAQKFLNKSLIKKFIAKFNLKQIATKHFKDLLKDKKIASESSLFNKTYYKLICQNTDQKISLTKQQLQEIINQAAKKAVEDVKDQLVTSVEKGIKKQKIKDFFIKATLKIVRYIIIAIIAVMAYNYVKTIPTKIQAGVEQAGQVIRNKVRQGVNDAVSDVSQSVTKHISNSEEAFNNTSLNDAKQNIQRNSKKIVGKVKGWLK